MNVCWWDIYELFMNELVIKENGAGWPLDFTKFLVVWDSEKPVHILWAVIARAI